MKKVFGIILLLGALVALSLPSHAQTANPTTVSIPNVGSSLITLQGSVPAGNAMTFTIVTNPVNGTLSNFNTNNGTFNYTPNPGFEGTDTLSFTVTATPLAGGAGTTSAAVFITIDVTGRKTTVQHQFLKPDGSPRSGKVSFILTQPAQSGAGLISVGSAVTATLDGSGYAQVSLYPSETLSPVSYYGVYLRDSVTGAQEFYGLYNVKPSLSGTVFPLGSATVVDVGRDANLRARFTFASQAAVEGLINQVRAYGVLNNGTAVGVQPTLNFIPGAGLSQTIVNNTGANRVDVTLNCPSCPGGSASLSTGTLGSLTYYSATNTVSSLGFGGANKVIGNNAGNTAIESKTISGAAPITVTHTAGSIQIGLSGSTFTLNGLNGASQSLAIALSGCTSPAWTAGGSTHYLCLPIAGPGVSYGLMSLGAQDFGGKKTFNGGIKMPGQPIEIYDIYNTSIVGKIGGDFIGHQYAAFGRTGAGPEPGAAFTLIDSGDDTARFNSYHGTFLNITTGTTERAHHWQSGFYTSTGNVTASLSGNYTRATYNAIATVTELNGLRGETDMILSGVVSNMRGVYGRANATIGTVNNGAALFAANATKGSSATLNNGYGLYVENQTAATNNYAIFTEQASTAVAGAISSLGGGLELRGAETLSQAGIAPTDAARLVYDLDTNKLRVSADGSNYQDLNGYGVRVTQTSSGSVSFNLALANVYDVTLSGAISAVTATNLAPGNVYTFIWRQPSGANYGLTEAGTVFRFAGGTNPGITAANGAVDIWTCTSDGSRLYCTVTYDVK